MDIKLTLKKKWFDMILSGEKIEEYRELKLYWERRFSKLLSKDYKGETIENIHFFNGGHFSDKLPNFKIKFEGIEIRHGKQKLGAENNKKYYVIKLGEIIQKNNC